MKPVVWHVVFHPREKGQWWARRFGHVSLAGWCDETWIHVDLHRTGVTVQTYFAHDEVQDFLSTMLAYGSVLKMPEVGIPISRFGRPMTCVSFVKHTLGVRSRALLPDQLFRTLLQEYRAEWLNEGQEARRDGRTETGPDQG